MNAPDSRDTYLTVKITQYEFDLILDDHRRCLLNQQFEAVALRTYSICADMRSNHAERRLIELSPEKYEALRQELGLLLPQWRKAAEEAENREMDGDSMPRLQPGESWDHSFDRSK